MSDAGDAITLTCANGLVKVNGSDPGTGPFACNQLAGIVVLGGPGDNVVDLGKLSPGDLQPGIAISADGFDGNDTLVGGPYAATLKGSAGDDKLFAGTAGDTMDGGEGSDTYAVQFGALAGPVNINDTGKAGTDTLAANGTPGDDSFQMDDTYLARDKEVINFPTISLEKATIQAGDGKDLFLLLCDRFITEFYGGPGSDTVTVKETEANTLLDGGEDGDTYNVDFGALLVTINIQDLGKAGFDILSVKAPVASASQFARVNLSTNLPQAGTWLITPSEVTYDTEQTTYSGSIEELDFRGSPADETIQVNPSPTTAIRLNGGGHIVGDTLVVDASGRPAISRQGEILVYGLQPVTYQDIQVVQLINPGFPVYLPLVLRSA